MALEKRKFGKDYYTSYADYYYKVDAEKKAKQFRKKGKKARVTKNTGELYREGDRYTLWTKDKRVKRL